MFKLLFRILSLVVILIVIIVVLTIWKGGGPFKWVGEKTVEIGESIEKFADMVDEIRDGGKKTGKQLKELKRTLDDLQNNEQEREKARE